MTRLWLPLLLLAAFGCSPQVYVVQPVVLPNPCEGGEYLPYIPRLPECEKEADLKKSELDRWPFYENFNGRWYSFRVDDFEGSATYDTHWTVGEMLESHIRSVCKAPTREGALAMAALHSGMTRGEWFDHVNRMSSTP